MNANGMKICVPMQPRVAISISCSGPEQMDAHGIIRRVLMQSRVDISISCSGPERMDAHGMKIIAVPMQLEMVISIFYSG